MTIHISAAAQQRKVARLFTNLTPEQVQTFVRDMNEAENNNTTENRSRHICYDKARTKPDSKNTRGTLRGKQSRARENAKLRPLNSFIAFRSILLSGCQIFL